MVQADAVLLGKHCIGDRFRNRRSIDKRCEDDHRVEEAFFWFVNLISLTPTCRSSDMEKLTGKLRKVSFRAYQ